MNKSLLFISFLLFNCGPSQEDYDKANLNFQNELLEKDKEVSEIKQTLISLDTEFGNYRVSSQKERDSLQLFSQNLSNALKNKRLEIVALQERLKSTTNDQLVKQYIEELSIKNQQLEELIIEKDNFIDSLKRANELYETTLDSLQDYQYRFNQLSILTNQIDEEISYIFNNSENLSEVPSSLINNYRVFRKDLDDFIFTANRMGQVRVGYKDLAKILENNYDKLGFKIMELKKKIDRKFFIFGSKNDLRTKNILIKNNVNISDLNPYYFKETSLNVNILQIIVGSKRDTPEVLSNHTGFTLKKESDLVWNLYIDRPLNFWANSNYLVIAY
jgi:hypothetical protein